MELKQYWQILWKRRWWVAIAFLVIFVTTGAVTLSMPPVFQASSKLLLEEKSKMASAIGAELAGVSALSSLSHTGSPLDTQSELLKSVPVIAEVIKRVDLRNPKTGGLLSSEDFLKRAKVTTIKGTDIIQLSFEDNSPVLVTQVADTWAQVYVEQSRSNNRLEASSAVKFITAQLEKTKRQLDTAEAALRDYKQANGAVDLSEEAKASVQSLSEIEAQLRQAEAARAESATRAGALQRQIGLSSNSALAATAVSQDPGVLALRKQLLAAETNPLLSDGAMTGSNPEVEQARAQVAALRKKLSETAAGVLGEKLQGVKQNLDPVRQAMTKDLVTAEINSLGYQTRVEALQRMVAGFNGRLGGLPDKEFALTKLVRDASATGELYKMLLQKGEEARIQEAMNVGNVRVVESASLPDKPIRPKKLQNMLIGLMVGLMAGVGLAMFVEYLDDTIQGTDDAEAAVGLPMLGVIPWLKATSDARLITLSDPRSPASESYRTLRTNIKFLSADTPLQMFTITSAGPEEGKSTTVANLAMCFAQTGKKVLLVDTDMRKPTIHSIFDLPNHEGLTSVLAGDRPLDEVIKQGPLESLFVLPCGPLPPNPAELIESQKMGQLIAELRDQFDVVLFDAPPIIAVTDASLLAARLDGLILLLGVNKVSRKAAHHAVSLLESAKVKVWGMVVRGVRPENDGYYYSYYHQYSVKVDTSDQERDVAFLPRR